MQFILRLSITDGRKYGLGQYYFKFTKNVTIELVNISITILKISSIL